MIFPIGRYAGATADGAHEVHRGGVTELLAPETFAAWGLAHGPIDPVLAAATPWTRRELVRYAGQAGLPEVDDRVTELVGRGLLEEVDRDRPDRFARSHRVVPLAVGLGNTAGQPGQYAIGAFERVLVHTDARRYEVWYWSAAYGSLWEVCEARAADDEATEVLSHFLAGTHDLAAANALYLDAVT